MFVPFEEVRYRILVGDAYFSCDAKDYRPQCRGHQSVVVMHTESGGASSGNSTSSNSPGQTVVDVGVGGECSTMAQCAAELTVTGCWDP